jgi:uncharacterized membrane protein YphA (DoxX/SURF4 family)
MPEIIKRTTEKLIKTKLTYTLARLVLGGLFIYASISKILNPHSFSKTIYDYEILPDFLIYFVAYTLPWIEFFSGAFLLVGIFIRSSALILSSLLTIFILITSINMFRGINIHCGCFTQNSNGINPSGFIIILRNLFILFPALIIIIFDKRKR